MSPIDPSQNPYSIANAYGAKPIRVRPVPADPRTQGANAAGLNPSQASPGQTPRQASGIARGADQLLAGSVNTRVDFMEGPPIGAKATKPSDAASPLAFYRHPADTNAAATSIDLGRRLDVEG